jgi:hypothetical protein
VRYAEATRRYTDECTHGCKVLARVRDPTQRHRARTPRACAAAQRISPPAPCIRVSGQPRGLGVEGPQRWRTFLRPQQRRTSHQTRFEWIRVVGSCDCV